MKKEFRHKIWNKFGGRCAYCGEDIAYKDMEIDHVIPRQEFYNRIVNKFRIPEFLSHLSEHDVDHPDNLFPACRVCNRWKKTFDLELFRRELQEQIDRLNKYSSNYRIAKKYGLVEEANINVVFYFEKILNL